MSSTPEQGRQHWLSVLAKADLNSVEESATAIKLPTIANWLRRPETGATMVRGRISGSGTPFNMGEMTVTRAAVRLADGTVGMGYAAGRSHRKVELIALIDAALQQDPTLAPSVIGPIEQAMAEKREQASRKAAATKVEFFTLVRGENEK